MPIEQVDRDAAEVAFDDVLGDAGSYAEYMRPSYREGGVRTLSEAFAAHREAERAAIVKWLREDAASLNASEDPYNWKCAEAVDEVADAIEAGEHLKGSQG